MVGNAAAMTSSLGFAVYTICVRSEPNHDWSPILPGYAFLMIIVCSIDAGAWQERAATASKT